VATNKVNDGNIVTVVAPNAVVSGRVVIVGTNLFGVALANAASAANVALAMGGVWTLSKPNAVSTAAAAGASAYWDNTNSQVTISATSNTKIGHFIAAVTNAQTSADVRLSPAGL
jgi:predicted RecA/RadA family phage recombinase